VSFVRSATKTNGTHGNYSQSYAYDSATGNLASKAGSNYTYGDTNHAHAVTAVGSNSYSYDSNGNMTQRNVDGSTYNLAYDGENHMIAVAGAVTATFQYRCNGLSRGA
jgi:hypothetical protein